jgi:hypothetical protein
MQRKVLCEYGCLGGVHFNHLKGRCWHGREFGRGGREHGRCRGCSTARARMGAAYFQVTSPPPTKM